MKNPLNINARRQERAALDREVELSLSGDWMDRVPSTAAGEPVPTAEELAHYMPLLSTGVAKAIKSVRDGAVDGYVMVGAEAEGLPPSFWQGIDLDVLEETVRQHEETASIREQDPAGLMPNARKMLESGGPAALALLASLEGRDGDPKVIQAIMDQRAIDAGLSVDFARRDSGFMIGSGPQPF